jgi:hypothetical protein
MLALANPNYATLETPFTATLTIMGSDTPPDLHFDAAVYTVGEGDGQAIITVTLSDLSAQTVTVEYATHEDSATAGIDYVATSGALTFNPGEMAKTFIVPIVNDEVKEPDEMVALVLNNPNHGLLNITEAILRILDDDDYKIYLPAIQKGSP